MRLFTKPSEDLKTALGQCFWIGVNGTSAREEQTRQIFETFQPGGVILFQRNVESIEQVQRLNADLQSLSEIPLFLSIDQEGGTVERLHEIIGSVPPAMACSAAGSSRLTRQLHGAHARILGALGFNVNFTPVLDLALSDADNGLGTRCFSDDPRLVTIHARDVIRAHQEAGILVCGKHFPGLGDTNLDSHLALPVVQRKWRRIVKEDLLPYRKLLKELPFIMVNHALYREKNGKLPASLSREIVAEFLLKDWNYQGLAVSDDLFMGAVSQFYNLPEACERALMAGNHMFLVCKPDGVAAAFKRLLVRASRDEKLARAIYRSSARIFAAKFRLAKQPLHGSSLPSEIKALKKHAAEISERSITALHYQPVGRWPESCTIYIPRTRHLKEEHTSLAKDFMNHACNVHELFYPASLTEAEGSALAAESRTGWNLVVITSTTRSAGQRELLKELLKRQLCVGVIHAGFPREALPEGIVTSVASYWTAPEALRAAGLTLLGERKPRGKLPLKRSGN